tara:strand:- start:546 stop:1130 length:585 start_codon:yes stop_codon:yes gene_type:complete
MKLIFATANDNKAFELQKLMGDFIEIQSLKDLLYTKDIEETETTLEGNSKLKSDTIFDAFNRPCFADDTGLEVEALNGAPGVYSARYSGPACNAEQNMALLLKNLVSHSNKKARFRTVITYREFEKTIQFEGVIEGKIIAERRGEYGFGYDPIFIPDGSQLTFAQMTLEEKNKFSHRARAFAKLKAYLMDKMNT